MAAESVGYCTGGTPHLAPPEIVFRQEQFFSYSPKTAASIQRRDMSADHCFHCKQKGHWARDCPQKSHGTPGPPQSPTPATNLSPKYPQQQYPELICKCNRPCAVKTSHTISNPGRDFYTCANPIKEQCGIFSWCDNASKLLERGANSPAKPDQQPGDQPQLPECLCRAGPCRIETVKEEGDLKGCKYYVCHLKKGQGACIHKVYITDMNMNHASNEMHLNCYQTTEEPNKGMVHGTMKDENGYCYQTTEEPNKGMVHGTMKDENGYTSEEKDPPAFSPTTPRSEHEVKHLQCGSPAVKRLYFLEGSSAELNCVEERLNDAEPAQVNCSAVNKASLTEAGEGKPVRCVVCGEEGHEVSECIAVAMW